MCNFFEKKEKETFVLLKAYLKLEDDKENKKLNQNELDFLMKRGIFSFTNIE